MIPRMLPCAFLRSKLNSLRSENCMLLNYKRFIPLVLSSGFVSASKDYCAVKNEPCATPKMANPENYKEATSIYDFSAEDIHGNVVSLGKYRGLVCIIVNVASQCGYTKNNYAELVELYDQYSESKGLRILAFPCNQFGAEEPGNSDEICSFVAKKNVKFDMFAKIDVNGSNAHPLWSYLKHKQGGTLGDFIKWNFTKFIIDKNGQPVERHGPSTNPKDLVKSLEKYW